MTGSNGEQVNYTFPTEPVPTPAELRAVPRPKRRSLVIAVVLFVLTVLSTLAVGTEFQLSYLEARAPFENGFGFYLEIWREPRLLVLGLPFSFTLLTILLAHELGHYFACRYYGIAASYPYFIPAPTIIGTMGAFIRIRSPIVNRKALFDVGLAGPVVGFLFAVPALIFGIEYSKILSPGTIRPVVLFGQPLLARWLVQWTHPDIGAATVFLHPVARAAWVGMFATALNLLPVGQLDGGHIVYALASGKHRKISLAFVGVLMVLGIVFWKGWLFWAGLLLVIGFRHPALIDRWEPIDAKRWIWAGIALMIFVVCFMPVPLAEP
jgi:membrane-associated protease RseP (regulator of RpoE activity)